MISKVFVPSAFVSLMLGERDIVKNFLMETLLLQTGEGLMPLSFKVLENPSCSQTVSVDFGVGGVAPIDCCLWWIILLRAYYEKRGDKLFVGTPNCQEAIRRILS